MAALTENRVCEGCGANHNWYTVNDKTDDKTGVCDDCEKQLCAGCLQNHQMSLLYRGRCRKWTMPACG